MHYLTEDDKTKLRRGSTDKITATYYDMVSEVVNVVSIRIARPPLKFQFYLSTYELLRLYLFNMKARKTESSLQRLRQGQQKRIGGSTDASDNIISDTDKICMQLFLDIQVR